MGEDELEKRPKTIRSCLCDRTSACADKHFTSAQRQLVFLLTSHGLEKRGLLHAMPLELIEELRLAHQFFLHFRLVLVPNQLVISEKSSPLSKLLEVRNRRTRRRVDRIRIDNCCRRPMSITEEARAVVYSVLGPQRRHNSWTGRSPSSRSNSRVRALQGCVCVTKACTDRTNVPGGRKPRPRDGQLSVLRTHSPSGAAPACLCLSHSLVPKSTQHVCTRP